MIILETERLYLRRFILEDAESLFLLNLDPDVIRHTGDESFKNIEEAVNFIKNYDHYQKYDFGRWAVINKTDDEFLGWCGLKYTPELNEYDIGFRFHKKHWNKGYATESAKACIELGFEKYNLPEIFGRALIENTASIKVLQKIGLKYFKNMDLHGEAGVIYKIEKGKIILKHQMQIVKTKILTPAEEQFINRLWNEEYPEKLNNRFLLLLDGIKEYNHHLLLNDKNEITGWAVYFIRDNECWFSIIVSSEYQSKGYGKLLIESLKSGFDQLNGWVIDHNNDLKLNGAYYISPMKFYMQNGFEIIRDKRIDTEMISAVKIKWRK